jgi:SAM-dependent methyltransferase
VPHPAFYDALAHLWPVLSPPEDYADEARYWRDALRAHFGGRRPRVLELGVGGGHNLSHLTGGVDAAAVDLSERMLANSVRLNPTVEHHVGDMRTVRLDREFDAVLIHDAISYLTTEEDLRLTFETAAAHLHPGGLLGCAPDWTRESFTGPAASVHGPRGEGGQVTFFEYVHDPDPTDTWIEVIYLFVLREGGAARVIEDRHRLGLFPLAVWNERIAAAGFVPGSRPYPVHPGGHGRLLTGVLQA